MALVPGPRRVPRWLCARRDDFAGFMTLGADSRVPQWAGRLSSRGGLSPPELLLLLLLLLLFLLVLAVAPALPRREAGTFRLVPAPCEPAMERPA